MTRRELPLDKAWVISSIPISMLMDMQPWLGSLLPCVLDQVVGLVWVVSLQLGLVGDASPKQLSTAVDHHHQRGAVWLSWQMWHRSANRAVRLSPALQCCGEASHGLYMLHFVLPWLLPHFLLQLAVLTHIHPRPV